MLILHIIIASITVITGVAIAARPSRSGIRATALLGGTTLASGIGLIVVSPDALAHACVSGIITLAAVVLLRAVAVRRLAAV